MSTADRRAEAAPDAASDEADPADASLDATSIPALSGRGDVEGLVTLARAFRTGTGVARDLRRCFEAYRAAADLGDAASEHAVALFYLAGGAVPRDEREGAGRLRAAADKGHVPAKVYLANLYEQGIHYKADPSKADVWYRNAARSAGLDVDPGTPAHQRAMAELGSVRHCLELVEDEGTSDDDRALFMRKALAYGYREHKAGDRASAAPASSVDPAGLEDAEEQAVASSRRGAALGKVAREGKANATPAAQATEKKADKAPLARWPKAAWGVGLTAFFYALVFMSAAVVGGTLLTEGASEMAARGEAVPVVPGQIHLILPILVGALGVFPTLLVYRFATSARAILVGAVSAGAGALLFGYPPTTMLATRTLQMVAFGVAGFLASLLVLGVLGGAQSAEAARRAR